jgi:hypothetical protein
MQVTQPEGVEMDRCWASTLNGNNRCFSTKKSPLKNQKKRMTLQVILFHVGRFKGKPRSLFF